MTTYLKLKISLSENILKKVFWSRLFLKQLKKRTFQRKKYPKVKKVVKND